MTGRTPAVPRGRNARDITGRRKEDAEYGYGSNAPECGGPYGDASIHDRRRGGNGANASVVGTAFGAGGGGGGGAGSVLIAANKVLALGTISSTGGTAGTGAGISTAASAGGVGPVIILSGSL